MKPRKKLIAHEVYLALGYTNETRQVAYRDLFLEDIPDDTLRNIRRSGEFSMFLGGNRFQ
ncbi:MAG: hypothetical protein COC09_03235 [Gammaproteobacteria bacterium]|nr:MAG: hypothetical protein COC09_03235 [Gammaproteobacteria bacterium]